MVAWTARWASITLEEGLALEPISAPEKAPAKADKGTEIKWKGLLDHFGLKREFVGTHY